MKKYKITIEGISPYSPGKHYSVPKLEKESHDAYERRTWRNRMHVSPGGTVQIPPMAVKNCLSEAAKFLSIQIPGKGKATYTKHFEAGVMILDPIDLGLAADEVQGQELFVPSDGRRGGGKRVIKVFPHIPAGWGGSTIAHILDETITENVLKQHLEEAGSLIGLGTFRPRSNGYFGRFLLKELVEL